MNAKKTGTATVKFGAILAGIVALALVTAIVTTSGQGDEATVGPYGQPAITGEALARWAGDAPDSTVGTPGPVVVGIGMDGASVELASSDRPQLIAFLAHWCPHCNAEVPVIVEWLANDGLPSGLDLIAVATSTDPGLPNFPPTTWLEALDWPNPVMLDNETSRVAAAYGVSSFPFWVVLDADGTVLLRTAGELTPAELDALAQVAMTP